MSGIEKTTARTVYDLAPVGVCVLSANIESPRVLYANDAFLALLNGVRFDQNRRRIALGLEKIQNQPISEIWPSDEIEPIIKSMTEERGSPAVEVSVSDPETADNRWALLSVSKTNFEEHPAWIMWATDITHSKRAEARLKLAAEEAETISEMKSSFLATMSHEIRTPMQSVYGLLELVREEELTADIEEMIDTAKASASGLLEILDDILDLTKVEAGKMELDDFEMPLRTLVRGVLEAMEVKVNQQKIEIKDEISEDLPFVVMGDPKRLRQVLINLLGNSIKFTEEGSVTVRVTKSIEHISLPEDGFGLRFEIIDTGIGMAPAVADKLFQPFTQADSSTTRRYGGTGLGLSISRSLIELMGGAIGVNSKEGEGSTFWFELPTREASEETSAELPDLEGLAVLSVEDHPMGAKEIKNSLQSMGAKVDSVPTYAEGLELIKARPFDVAVVDHGLPDGLGLDLMREVARIRPFCGLIMYTVRDDAGLQHSINALGAKFLTKPASRLGLGETVKASARQAPVMEYDGPQKLLIAEDTLAVEQVLKRQLKKLGAEADFVANGKLAWDAIQSGEYGILFTDLHMPEMDGYTLVRKIREREAENGADRRFPVIALTADVQLAQRHAYLEHGFDECLLKPVSLGQFRHLLIRWGVLHEETGTDSGNMLDMVESETPERPVAVDDASAIDRNEIVNLMGAFDESAVEMLGLFVEMTEPLILQIQDKVNDPPELGELAHSLKGAARSACCTRLGDLASDLQDKAGEEDDKCRELVREIALEFERVRQDVLKIQQEQQQNTA